MTQQLYQLLTKYNVAGPRYTSYPTVPAWQEKINHRDYQHSLEQVAADEKISLYFHLPFCEKLCHFCGCLQVITTDHSKSREYVDVLKQEINWVDQFLAGKRAVSQIHFGGGTPNFLQPEELAEIMELIHQKFNVQSDAEIAIEMHPRTSTQAFCDTLKELNFNRISLGVQDFDEHVQTLIHRGQTYAMTETMVNYLRKLGFASFNFDLIYGLPGQNESTWQKTLELVLQLDPDRLAVYSYAHVPWVRPVQRSFKDTDLPSPELKLKLFTMAYDFFMQQQYELIGMDHFAKTDDELVKAKQKNTLHRNFMGYATRADAHQLGFGISAISYVAGNYFQNLKELKTYYASVRKQQLATFRGFMLSEEDHIRRDLIMQIMCHGHVDLQSFANHWKIDFEKYFLDYANKLAPFVADGLLALNHRQLKVQGLGFLFLRNIAMCFDAYLTQIQAGAQNPVFSKTV